MSLEHNESGGSGVAWWRVTCERTEMRRGRVISGLVGSPKQTSTEQMLNNRLSEKRNQIFMALKTKLSFSLIRLVNIPKIGSPLCW